MYIKCSETFFKTLPPCSQGVWGGDEEAGWGAELQQQPHPWAQPAHREDRRGHTGPLASVTKWWGD